MNNILKLLYFDYAKKQTASIEFERCYSKILKTEDKDEVYDLLANVCDAEEEKAFYAGFRTAVQLLMGGNGNE